jgi:hypothetical protein
MSNKGLNLTYRIYATKDGATLLYYPESRKVTMDTGWGLPHTIKTREKFLLYCKTHEKYQKIFDNLVQELEICWRPWDGKPELLSEQRQRKRRIAVMIKLRRLLTRDIACEIAKLM